jgi:hypothetical protein
MKSLANDAPGTRFATPTDEGTAPASRLHLRA